MPLPSIRIVRSIIRVAVTIPLPVKRGSRRLPWFRDLGMRRLPLKVETWVPGSPTTWIAWRIEMDY
jgi:hypothetical protein